MSKENGGRGGEGGGRQGCVLVLISSAPPPARGVFLKCELDCVILLLKTLQWLPLFIYFGTKCRVL